MFKDSNLFLHTVSPPIGSVLIIWTFWGKEIKNYQTEWESFLEGYVWKHRFCNSILKLTFMLLEYHSTCILREIIQFTKPNLKSYFSQYLDAPLNIVHFSRSATGRQIAHFCWTNSTSTNSASLYIAVFIFFWHRCLISVDYCVTYFKMPSS